jgi:hypothetical protein
MTAKDRRDRLFKKGRPHFRKAELLDGDSYGKDMGLLWAAYKAGSFNAKEGLTQDEFAQWILEHSKLFMELWIGEDESDAFSVKRGGVGVVGVNYQDLLVTAEGQVFKWATKRNVLRLCVGFLHMVTHSKKTGVCMVKANNETQKLADHMKEYGLLHYVGKTGQNEFLYSVRGRGS